MIVSSNGRHGSRFRPMLNLTLPIPVEGPLADSSPRSQKKTLLVCRRVLSAIVDDVLSCNCKYLSLNSKL